MQEKADRGHRDLLRVLHAALVGRGWTGIEEIPSAFDLRAGSPRGHRAIFEAKTLRPRTELTRVRGGVAQLLEYRFVHGRPSDRLCLVVDHPVNEKRVRFLDSLGVAVVVIEDGKLGPGSATARERLDGLLD